MVAADRSARTQQRLPFPQQPPGKSRNSGRCSYRTATCTSSLTFTTSSGSPNTIGVQLITGPGSLYVDLGTTVFINHWFQNHSQGWTCNLQMRSSCAPVGSEGCSKAKGGLRLPPPSLKKSSEGKQSFPLFPEKGDFFLQLEAIPRAEDAICELPGPQKNLQAWLEHSSGCLESWVSWPTDLFIHLSQDLQGGGEQNPCRRQDWTPYLLMVRDIRWHFHRRNYIYKRGSVPGTPGNAKSGLVLTDGQGY